MPTKRKSTFPQKDFVAIPKRFKTSTRVSVKKAVLAVAETKTKTITSAEIALINAANPIYFDWPVIMQGTNVTERIGNKVTAVGLRTSVVVHNNGTAAGSQMFARLVLLRVDEGRYRTNADITTFFFEDSADATLSGGIQDILREPNREGVKVLWDRIIPLGLNIQSTGTDVMKHVKKTVALNQKMIFRDTGAADATNVRYTLACFARDGANDGAATTVECSVANRIDYKDN